MAFNGVFSAALLGQEIVQLSAIFRNSIYKLEVLGFLLKPKIFKSVHDKIF